MMANSIKTNGRDDLIAFRRRVIRQYNLPGTGGEPHRISSYDRDELVKLVDELISKVEAVQEFSPDLQESPF